MIGKERHLKKVISLQLQAAEAFDKKTPIRTIRKFTHSTRSAHAKSGDGAIDLRALDQAIELNLEEDYLWVESGVTMQQLVDVSLIHGKIPPVLPEFPMISVGGAISGPALESGSFRYGQFNDTCPGFEVVTADGNYHTVDCIKSTTESICGKLSSLRHGEDKVDLWHGIPGSMGTLGIITGIKVGLVNAADTVKLTYHAYSSVDEVMEHFKRVQDCPDLHYLEGIVFSKDLNVAIEGRRSKAPPGKMVGFSKWSDPWYWRHVRKKGDESRRKGKAIAEYVSIRDYLFRYNRGAFWMGEFVRKKLHLGDDWFSRWLMDPIVDTASLYSYMHHRKTADTYLIQDIYTPIDNTAAFVGSTINEYGIFPIWLDPIRPTHSPQKNSPHYYPEQKNLLVDVGVWGRPGGKRWSATEDCGRFNQLVEAVNGSHMAYAAQNMAKEDFDRCFDSVWNERLRRKFNAEESFPDLYSKVGSDQQAETSRKEGLKRFLNEWSPGGLNGQLLKWMVSIKS